MKNQKQAHFVESFSLVGQLSLLLFSHLGGQGLQDRRLLGGDSLFDGWSFWVWMKLGGYRHLAYCLM